MPDSDSVRRSLTYKNSGFSYSLDPWEAEVPNG